ncbi:MAG: hypothetical protein HC805_07450 [Alkalinema sp. RL_2_19]|nr:hypothetical protein [Alkalinema sp. RL_2_19]
MDKLRDDLQSLQAILVPIAALNLPDNFVPVSELAELRASFEVIQSRTASLKQEQADTQSKVETAITRLADEVNQLHQTQSQMVEQLTDMDGQLQVVRMATNGNLPSISPPETLNPPELPLRPQPESPSVPSQDAVTPQGQYTPQLPIVDEQAEVINEINLGIDFGTGFTKVCFRDLARDRSAIVTFSETASRAERQLEQVLLSTKVAILEDGTLLSGLTTAEWQVNARPIHCTLEYIKMRLAHLDLPEHPEWRLDQIPALDQPETVENVCAYYLSTVIARAKAWIQQHRPDLFTNSTVRWSFNMGVPVEYCDSGSLRRFKYVLSLAWLLVNTPFSREALTLSTLNQICGDLRDWLQTNLSGKTDKLDCFTTPEISAAVWSFLSSRQAVEKFYTFFDFGDGTLDGTAFRFWRENDGDLKVDFYTGQVKPLGVTAFTQQTASELNVPPETVHQAIVEWPAVLDDALQQHLLQSKTRNAIQKVVGAVVMQGNEKHRENRGDVIARDELGRQLDIFVGGGGGHNSFLKAAVQATYKDFRQDRADIPPYCIKHIPTPQDLAMNGVSRDEFHRFAVAYGLAIPSWEGPEIRLPSQIEIEPETPPVNSYVPPRYDEMRGSW